MVLAWDNKQADSARGTWRANRRKNWRPKSPNHRNFERLESRWLLSLTHQYTFNNGTANDSIGGANGTLIHGAQIIDGWLTLNNLSIDTTTGAITNITSGAATAQYAQLPSGVLPASGSATIEAWYTSSSATYTNSLQNWWRVFDFGDQVSGSGNSYFFYTPRSSSSDARAVLRPAGGSERVAALAGGTFDGYPHMAAVVVDSAAAQLRLYVDGTLSATTALSGAGLNSISSSLAFLGRSLFDADPGFTGGIDEVRIYNDAESATAIAAAAADGATRAAPTLPAKQIENLDRGLVGFNRSNSQVYLSWRLLATDPGNIAFNVYRSTDGESPVKRNSSPISKTTDFTDTGVTQSAANEYFVRAVVNGVEEADSPHFTIPANTAVNQFLTIPLNVPAGGTLPDGTTYTYTANDASVGDLDGDGKYEIILKWDSNPSYDSSQDGFTGPVLFDAYKLDGTFMWRINLGQNIRAGAHYTQFMVYDLDGDGKAEIAMKTAPGTIDGLGVPVLMGNDHVTDDYRNSTTGRINTGPEYLTVFSGQTGGQLATVAFKPDRINTSSWGDDYGNRQDRILMSIAYLDGTRPSLVVGRGLFGPQSSGHAVRNELTAWNFRNGQLTMLWWFRAEQNTSAYGLPNVNTAYIGQGNYEMQPADVDGDGKDEIVYGSMTVNDNGVGLYSTGLGHGDALGVSDMDQFHAGEEIYMPMESPGGNGHITANVHDAATGAIIFDTFTRTGDADPDVGRGNAFDLDPRYPGFEEWDSYNTNIAQIDTGAPVQAKPSNMFVNFAIQWDADPLYELEDGTTISNWVITNGSGGRSNFDLDPNSSSSTTPNASSNNGTKSTPALAADIFGDSRDEVIWRKSDNTALFIYSTVIPESTRMVTPMDDLQYREAIAWQNVGYNQPPHPSYYMGDGMRTLPKPDIGPANITLSANTVAENQPAGTVIGNLSTTPSGNVSTYTYSLVSGFGGDGNASFQIVSGQLQTSTTLDYEAKSLLSVRIRTTDANGLFFDKRLMINVTDVNEPPTAVNLVSAISRLNQNTSTATHVKLADIVITDDALGTNNLALSGADAASFEIQGTSLYLKAGTTLDPASKPTYNVNITVDDPSVGATPDASVPYTLTINAFPTVAMAASATPNPSSGTSTLLSVLGGDDAGEANLTYAWTTTSLPSGASPPTFSANGSNAAKNSTATFHKAGSYTFQVTVTDGGGLSITSSVNVTVNQTFTSININPPSVTVGSAGTAQFGATALDQFGDALPNQPAFDWSITGGPGSIDNSGLYTAPYASGGATIHAASGSITKAASVTIVNAPPTVAIAAGAAPNPADGTTSFLSVLGADDAGESNITYTWSAIGPDAVIFNVNGSNAAKNSTATFSKAGSYTLTASLTDAGGLTATSNVNVVVDQTLTTISISPASANVEPNLSQLFSATALDQFGNPLTTQPAFSWTTDSGSVDASGLYTATSSTGSAIVRAAAAAISGTANVNVAWLKGDIDGNGSCEVSDLSAMMSALGDLSVYQTNRNLTDPDVLAIANIDADNLVTNLDLQSLIILLANAADAGPGSGSLAASSAPSGASASASLGAAAGLPSSASGATGFASAFSNATERGSSDEWPALTADLPTPRSESLSPKSEIPPTAIVSARDYFYANLDTPTSPRRFVRRCLASNSADDSVNLFHSPKGEWA